MHMQIEWVKKVPKIRDETKLNPTLQHILELVERQLRIMNDPQYGHILTTKRKPIDPKNKLPKPPPKPPLQNQISTLTTNLENSGLCPCCKGKHSLTNCESFVKKTPEERWEIVKNLKLCHLCLASGHMKAQCISTTICKCKATYKHHPLLHRIILPPKDNSKFQSNDRVSSNTTQRQPEKDKEKPERAAGSEPPKSKFGKDSQQDSMASYTTMTQRKENHVLLHVVPVKVLTKDGNSVTTYGLLDNASRGTIVDAKLAEKLNVKVNRRYNSAWNTGMRI